MSEETTAGSDMVFEFFCEFCKDDGLNLEAKGYCVDCKEYLCLTCFTHHKRNRASRHHDLLDKDRMPKGTPLVYEEKMNKDISTKCKQHNGATVKYYCRSHGVLGCSDCFVSDHGRCSDIVNILEEADVVFESQEYKDLTQFIKSLDERSRNILNRVRENESNVKSYSSDTIKDLRHFVEAMSKTLAELESGLTTMSEKIKSEDENNLKKVSDICKVSLESTEEIIEEFGRLKTSRRVCQAYIRMIEAKTETMQLEMSLRQAEKQNVIRVQWFDPNKKLKETLANESDLGCISVQDSSFTATVESSPYNPVKIRAKCVGEIDVRSNRDISDSCIFGSAVVSSNRLIVTDNETLKVKLLDTKANKLISELKVPSWPWDVAAISRSLVAVTLYGRRIILLLRVSNALTLEKEIAVHGECKGVAYTKDKLVVTYINPPKLEIMDLNGSVIKKIVRDNGRQLFRCPLYSCVSNDGDIIYVSDAHYGSERVISLTFDGVVKSVYIDSELKRPQKICVDKHDNVYVCGNYSDTVHMLSPDLIKIQIILTKKDGLDNNVRSLSHCQETNRLFVGGWNKVKVFQLSK